MALSVVIATFQTFSSFGRVNAAYGGVFIILSILRGGVLIKIRLGWCRNLNYWNIGDVVCTTLIFVN